MDGGVKSSSLGKVIFFSTCWKPKTYLQKKGSKRNIFLDICWIHIFRYLLGHNSTEEFQPSTSIRFQLTWKLGDSFKHSCYINHPFSGSRSNKGRDPGRSWFFCWCLYPHLSLRFQGGEKTDMTHWKTLIFNSRNYIFKWWRFHCHVFFFGVCIYFFQKLTLRTWRQSFIPVETGNGSITAMPPGCLRLVELAQQHQSNTTFATRMAPRFCRRICSLPTVHWLSRDLCWL